MSHASNALPETSHSGGVTRRVPAVLVVDDEADLRELVALTIVKLGFDVDTAGSLARARELLAQNSYALCLTDMRLGDGSGMDLVREIAAGAGKGPPVAVITAFGSAENAVAALKAGAFDYLTKPVDVEQLRLLVRSALRDASAVGAVRATLAADGASQRLLGQAPAMQQLRSMIERLGRSMAPVAIFGESGSGKELVARAIHEHSSRCSGPFVAVNCGAIPEALMEAEFFGNKKGAFTGADRERDGYFQAAAGGTLFLDEVAELPLPMQVKLLRALQERRVRKVGATQEEPVDVRLLSATHQDLPRMVAAGRFRQDLFYRLDVIELRVPSLRERAQDIVLIAHAILERAVAHGAPRVQLSDAACEALEQYPFPGNVRELENVLERAVALASDGVLQPEDLMLPTVMAPLSPEISGALHRELPLVTRTAIAAGVNQDDEHVAATAPESPQVPDGADALTTFEMRDGVPSNLGAYLDALEREAIRAALARTHQNRTAAAPLLGMTFRQLRYRMQRLGLK